jgi:hypothetical protein
VAPWVACRPPTLSTPPLRIPGADKTAVLARTVGPGTHRPPLRRCAPELCRSSSGETSDRREQHPGPDQHESFAHVRAADPVTKRPQPGANREDVADGQQSDATAYIRLSAGADEPPLRPRDLDRVSQSRNAHGRPPSVSNRRGSATWMSPSRVAAPRVTPIDTPSRCLERGVSTRTATRISTSAGVLRRYRVVRGHSWPPGRVADDPPEFAAPPLARTSATSPEHARTRGGSRPQCRRGRPVPRVFSTGDRPRRAGHRSFAADAPRSGSASTLFDGFGR